MKKEQAVEDSKPKNYASDSKVKEACAKIYQQVLTGYSEEKKQRTEDNEEYWSIYNCELGDNQQYDGDSQVYEPIVRDAIEARRKRFTGMLFPTVGNNIECISEQGDTPAATLSILQRHVRETNLRSVVSKMFLNGDVEGQWSLMVDWKRKERTVTRKVSKEIATEEYADIEEETVVEEGPELTVISDADLWFFPSTVAHIQDAEIVSVALRLTDEAINEKVKEGVFLERAVKKLQKDAGDDKVKWTQKARTADAGVKMKAGQKFTLIYLVFAKITMEGEKRPAVMYLAGEDNVLGVIANPYWSQKVPIMTRPVDEVAGSLWGKSRVAPVAPLQYQLNDITNMGMDSAVYSLMPIVMTDPLKNPQYSTMVLAQAAVWSTNPNDTKVVEFPPLYQHSLTIRGSIKQQIMESMDVNETMLGKAPAGRKNAQAVAQQSAEAMATIGDVVKRFEQILNELLEWFYELDLQFREEDLIIVEDGEHGVRSIIERIPPQQHGKRYQFRWLGADKAMGAQNVQQMIAWMNVLRGLQPQFLNGRKIDIGPLIDFCNEAICGPTMSKNVLIDERHKLTIPPEIENDILLNNMPVHVSPMDDDIQHMQMHQMAAQASGDPTGIFRQHIAEHAKSMQAKMQQQMPKGAPGIPGGAGPGVAGTPRPGSIPVGPRNVAQQPNGAIHQDQMADAQAGMRG